MSSPVARSSLWLALLTIAGCCQGGAGGDASHVTRALELSPAEQATALPAEWFLAAAPDAVVSSDALQACHTRGDVRDIPLVFAVVEVAPGGISVGGRDAMVLDGGHLGGEDAGWLIQPLYDALDELLAKNRDLASGQCRPWSTGLSFRPDDLLDADQPPLLLAFDREIPQATLARVVYTCAQAGAEDLLLWVDDPQPFEHPLVPIETVEQETVVLDFGANVGALVAELDGHAREGVSCLSVAVPSDEGVGEPASISAGRGAPHALARETQVPVIPLRLPRVGVARPIGSPPASGKLADLLSAMEDTETLLTGHICPITTVEVTGTLSDPADTLGEGLSGKGLTAILEEIELTPVQEQTAAPGATPTP